MARPLRNTFEQDSPMTPQSAASISYQTNVNRQKTKKWTEAKTVNYGGDDWGDDDEYDDPPPPISKPTGFRQQGQGIRSATNPEPPALDNSRKYGELPPLPPANDPPHRRNSFDADDERRNFSNATVRKPSPAAATPTSSGPATRFSQITEVSSTRNASGPPSLSIQTQPPQAPTGIRKPNQMIGSPVSESPHPDILNPGRMNTNDSSLTSPKISTPSTASDLHARRDYSPSALPPPLSSRAPAAPHPTIELPSAKFPARKSSLSQSMGPPLSEITGPPRPSPTEIAPKPWISGRPASPGAAAKSPVATTGKALPFIRPADIYRRAEEERRQSLEFSRPSMDSISRPKSSERSESPAVPQLREKLSSDSLGAPGRRRTSFDGDDGSESGRRLMPMLEPVKERKSEYGFEGVNLNDQILHDGSIPDLHPEPSMDNEEVDDDKPRRLLTSPKLPILTRMSGFGIDMFSEPKPQNAESTKPKIDEPASATLSPTEDMTLRSQPSFGFKSVVKQAFDRVDDNSVPPTPASIDGSGVGRTDSHSTGTTGISPIMSRIPSGASESRHGEMANPSISEVVNDPDSPQIPAGGETIDAQRGRKIPDFKPGYRRAISTPRTENSPARTPDLAKSKIDASGQQAIVSEPSQENDTAEEETSQPLRPTAEWEASFRPTIPGGWTSYATTAQSEDKSQAPSTRAATPVQDVSPARELGVDDLDLTPTAAKHAAPKSGFNALSEIPISREIGSADNGSLPTPDPALAPTSNLYSTTSLDPRLLPKVEQAPAETQVRPDATDRDSPAQLNASPLPPPKPVAEDHATSNVSEPTAKSIVASQLPSSAENESPGGNSDTMDDEHERFEQEMVENEKLEQEIVKSLTPRPSEGGVGEGMLDDELDDANYPNQGRESTYLPSEYDNYWNSTSDDEGHGAEAVAPAKDPFKPDVPQIQAAVRNSHLDTGSPVIAPLSPRRSQQPALEPSRPVLGSRLSWENSNERLDLATNEEVSSVSAASSPIRPAQPIEDISLPPNTTVSKALRDEETPVATEAQVQGSQAVRETNFESHHTNMLLAEAGVASLTAATIPSYNMDQQEPKSRRLSLAEEKDPRVSAHPVSPTPPEDQHPARAAQSYFGQSPNLNSPIAASSPVSPIPLPSPEQQNMPPVGRLGAFPKFSEIATLRTPQERINEFELTRQRYALMNSGLNEWMATIQNQYPEHAGVGPFYAGSRTSLPTGTGRSKFGKATSSTGPPLQPPYYQQYLNASSPTNPSSPVGPRPGPASASTSGLQQGFSSSSGKLTSQQVQAKGKELLHTAGIFGGKAGKAGKGLLAKGKSRFRVGGDKDPSPPKPKHEQPKQDRRSSWGLPLSLARSSGHSNSQGRESKESIPSSGRPRAATTSSTRSAAAAPQLPDVPTGDSLMVGDMPSMHAEMSKDHQSSPSTRQYQQLESNEQNSEARDSLSVPAPIGKHQPSWDPYNATPIAEEEVFQYDERPTERQFPTDIASHQGSLSVPVNEKSSSERSNSGDTHFYSAPEEEADNISDWVMVPPKQETKTTLLRTTPADDTKAKDEDVSSSVPPTQQLDPNTARDSNDRRKSMEAPMKSPLTSILDRPRGSSYSLPSPPSSSRGLSPTVKEPVDVNTPRPGLTLSPPNTLPAEPPKQSSSGSFLPPIRRTSTFGLGFGSRHAKTRFSLEDEHEQQIPEVVAEAVPVVEPTPNKLVSNPTPVEPTIAAAPVPPESHAPDEQNLDENSIPPSGTSPVVAADMQKHVSASNQAHHGLRPLSFIQAPGVEEVLHTSSQSDEAKPNAVHVESSKLPKYFEPPLSTQEANKEAQKQQPNGIHPVSNAKQALPLESSGHRSDLAQSTSSEYNQGPGQSQLGTLPQAITQPKMANSTSPVNIQNSPNTKQGMASHTRHVSQNSQLPPLIVPRAKDVLERPEFRESQVEWRQSRPKASDPPPPVVSPSYWKDVEAPAPRSSLDQHQRGWSGSSPIYSGRPDGQYSDRAWVGSPIQQNPYPQPPSSAQRYPELFRPGQQGADARDSVDLPAHYYQAPITRADAFLPRQQTNEYQIAGVGPPVDDPRNSTSRRNSSFLKEIGGKLSRASSSEKGDAHARENGPPSPRRRSHSRGNDYADSVVTTDTNREHRRRRSSFFGNLGRSSTTALEPPLSRESIIAHNSASRSDLLASSLPSPVQQERKRSFFGGSSKDPKVKANKLVRSSTGTTGTTGNAEPAVKKNRFSGLSGMFSKSSQSGRESFQERPQASREGSYSQNPPIQSTQLDTNGPGPNTATLPPNQGAPNQSKKVLHKFSSSASPRSSPGIESKPRRSSGAGLLGGLIGRKSTQQERGSDDSRSQGSSQPRTTAQVLPTAQTYSDLQGEEQTRPNPIQQRREIPFQDPTIRVAERGREPIREPQYDSVPIPGGYSLVRGQGALPAAPDYGARTENHMPQVDPRYAQPTRNFNVDGLPTQTPPQYRNDGRYGPGQRPQQSQSPPQSQMPRNLLQPNPRLGALETHANYTARIAPRRVSREDLIARSPALSLEGQQRPYQISLPGGDDEGDRPVPIAKDEAPVLLKLHRPQHDAIQRLQQPTVRHPESPAGYPLPEDTVFSPINAGVNDIPPPPPPQWPDRMEPQPSFSPHSYHARQTSLSAPGGDLDRSNTRGTAVQAFSGLSEQLTGGLNVPTRQISNATETDHDRRHPGSPSPSPPSPMPGTPDKNFSPELRHERSQNDLKHDIRTTELTTQRSREDLYNASPKLPKPGPILPCGLTQLSTPSNSANMSNYNGNHPQYQASGKENVHAVGDYAAAVPVSESKPQGHVARESASTQAPAPEEKIAVREGTAGRAELPAVSDDDGPPEMSAVSYPGMEWNPYAAGAWDDGFD